MCVRVSNNTTHSHLRCALDQAVGHEAVRVGNTVQCTCDSKDTVMHTWNDLADTSANSSLVAQVRNVLACLADDNAGFLGCDNGAEGELGLTVLLVSARTILGVK